MNAVPGFKTRFNLDGEEAAKEEALASNVIITFWDNKKKKLAIPLLDGICILPFETKNEVFLTMETLLHFGFAYGGSSR